MDKIIIKPVFKTRHTGFTKLCLHLSFQSFLWCHFHLKNNIIIIKQLKQPLWVQRGNYSERCGQDKHTYSLHSCCVLVSTIPCLIQYINNMENRILPVTMIHPHHINNNLILLINSLYQIFVQLYSMTFYVNVQQLLNTCGYES